MGHITKGSLQNEKGHIANGGSSIYNYYCKPFYSEINLMMFFGFGRTLLHHFSFPVDYSKDI